MVRINRVYTKTGDQGETALVGGKRVAKDASRIEAYGTVDELNAALGLVHTHLEHSPCREVLLPIVKRLQNELFNLGAELATADPAHLARSPHIEARHVTALEADIDRLNNHLPELRSFVLPGGGELSARLHLARTICRRAERRIVALAKQESLRNDVIIYLNRLSDALFVFGRYTAHEEGQTELLWEPEKT